MKTLSSREFNRDVSAAKRAARSGPVVITDRGKAKFVLLSIDDYHSMSERRSLVDVLSMDEADYSQVDIEFEPVVSRELPRPADL